MGTKRFKGRVSIFSRFISESETSRHRQGSGIFVHIRTVLAESLTSTAKIGENVAIDVSIETIENRFFTGRKR